MTFTLKTLLIWLDHIVMSSGVEKVDHLTSMSYVDALIVRGGSREGFDSACVTVVLAPLPGRFPQ